jgi:hypothetical protein
MASENRDWGYDRIVGALAAAVRREPVDQSELEPGLERTRVDQGFQELVYNQELQRRHRRRGLWVRHEDT